MTDQEKMAALLQQVPEMQSIAKALWGEGKCECGSNYHEEHGAIKGKITIHGYAKDWKHHLQMMVISDDPIKYLGENI